MAKKYNVAREETIPEVFAIGVNGKYGPGYDSGNEGELITVDDKQ